MSSAHTSLGAYATDALDHPDAVDVERHLAECEWCRAEFDELSETAAELTRLVATPPPSELRGAVLRSIAGVRPLPPETQSEIAPGPASQHGGSSGSRRVLSFPSRALLAVAAAAVAIAVAVGGYAFDAHRQLAAAEIAQTDGSRQQAAAQQESSILQASDATVHASRLQDGNNISYLVSKDRNAAMMISPDLADPGTGRTYQLWTVVRTAGGGTSYLPDRTFGGGRDQRIFLTGNIADAVGLAITVEPAGGSPRPTAEPDAKATL